MGIYYKNYSFKSMIGLVYSLFYCVFLHMIDVDNKS